MEFEHISVKKKFHDQKNKFQTKSNLKMKSLNFCDQEKYADN